MGMTFQCPGSNGQPGQVIQLTTVSSGNAQPIAPNFNARAINLCMLDVQQTIQEGRASGTIKPFNLSGSTDMKN